jgi:hypothetical protein
MVVLTDRVFFCVVLHAIGVAQLAFASLTSQANARKYLGEHSVLVCSVNHSASQIPILNIFDLIASDPLWDAKPTESSIGSETGLSSKLGKLGQREELGHEPWHEYTQTYEKRACEFSDVNVR